MCRFAAVIALATVLVTPAVSADLDARLTLASDYVHRGIAQSDGEPVVQMLVDLESDTGFYAGAWASDVDYDFPGDRREREVDYFAGFIARPSPSLAVDIGFVRYTYDRDRAYDWIEFQLTAHAFDRWSLMVAAAEDWLSSDARTYVVEAAYRHPLPGRLVIDATLGWQLADDVLGQRYHYGEIGVSRAFGPLDFRAGWSGTQGVERLAGLDKDRWIFSIAWLPLAR